MGSNFWSCIKFTFFKRAGRKISTAISQIFWPHCAGPHRVQELMTNLAQDRYFHVTSDELEKIKKSANLLSGWCNENDCKETMIAVWNKDRYIMAIWVVKLSREGSKISWIFGHLEGNNWINIVPNCRKVPKSAKIWS